jgi:hypothetical protein
MMLLVEGDPYPLMPLAERVVGPAALLEVKLDHPVDQLHTSDRKLQIFPQGSVLPTTLGEPRAAQSPQ